MSKLCKLRKPKVYKRLYSSICEHATMEITFVSKVSKKTSHVWRRLSRTILPLTPAHNDGRGTGGRRLWHFMKRGALSGIPLVLCACTCLCVREKYRRKERERQKRPSWPFLCLNMVWKTKRGQGGDTQSPAVTCLITCSCPSNAITGRQLFLLPCEPNMHVE